MIIVSAIYNVFSLIILWLIVYVLFSLNLFGVNLVIQCVMLGANTINLYKIKKIILSKKKKNLSYHDFFYEMD